MKEVGHLYSRTAERNCLKSPDSFRIEASEVDETSRKSSVSLLGNPKMEAPGATLDPFQTVSEEVFSESRIPLAASLCVRTGAKR
jgi:hypothetical protein